MSDRTFSSLIDTVTLFVEAHRSLVTYLLSPTHSFSLSGTHLLFLWPLEKPSLEYGICILLFVLGCILPSCLIFIGWSNCVWCWQCNGENVVCIPFQINGSWGINIHFWHANPQNITSSSLQRIPPASSICSETLFQKSFTWQFCSFSCCKKKHL